MSCCLRRYSMETRLAYHCVSEALAKLVKRALSLSCLLICFAVGCGVGELSWTKASRPQKYLGCFDDAAAAAREYDKAAKELLGEAAQLNFPVPMQAEAEAKKKLPSPPSKGYPPRVISASRVGSIRLSSKDPINVWGGWARHAALPRMCLPRPNKGDRHKKQPGSRQPSGALQRWAPVNT